MALTGQGGVEVFAANVEYGQGTNTVLTQIAAEALQDRSRPRGDSPAGHSGRAEQRSYGGFAHDHGRGETRRARRAGTSEKRLQRAPQTLKLRQDSTWPSTAN